MGFASLYPSYKLLRLPGTTSEEAYASFTTVFR